MNIHAVVRIAVAVIATAWIGLAQSVAGESMKISSPDFKQGGSIPARYTCDGENVNPSVSISGVPAGAKSLVLIVDDPDAPHGTWTHWLLWNISPGTDEIATGSAPGGAVQGVNDFSKNTYGGPCPPSGTHRYFFKLYALDKILDIPESSKRKALDHALQGHVIAETEYMGTYSRSR